MVNFKALWENYPDDDPCYAKNKDGHKLFNNQCDIRLGYAMKKSGIRFNTFPKSRKCWVHPGLDHILAAAELADWIQDSKIPSILVTEIITGEDWRDRVESRKGIICFENYYLRSNGSGGDHIDLWNGRAMAGIGSYFRIRFDIVIPSIWSDLGKSKKIRLFPVS